MSGFNAAETGPPLDNCMTYTPPQPNAALVVGSDDVLVLSFHSLTLEQMEELKGILRDKFPGLVDRVLFVGGAEDIAVVTHGVPEKGLTSGS